MRDVEIPFIKNVQRQANVIWVQPLTQDEEVIDVTCWENVRERLLAYCGFYVENKNFIS